MTKRLSSHFPAAACFLVENGFREGRTKFSRASGRTEGSLVHHVVFQASRFKPGTWFIVLRYDVIGLGDLMDQRDDFCAMRRLGEITGADDGFSEALDDALALQLKEVGVPWLDAVDSLDAAAAAATSPWSMAVLLVKGDHHAVSEMLADMSRAAQSAAPGTEEGSLLRQYFELSRDWASDRGIGPTIDEAGVRQRPAG